MPEESFKLMEFAGMSESLSRELTPFGIRVIIVEPAAGLNHDYIGTPLETTLNVFRAHDGKQTGDPVMAAQRVLDVVTGTGIGAGKENLLRLPLGPDCYQRFQAKLDAVQDNLAQAKEIAHSTNF